MVVELIDRKAIGLSEETPWKIVQKHGILYKNENTSKITMNKSKKHSLSQL